MHRRIVLFAGLVLWIGAVASCDCGGSDRASEGSKDKADGGEKTEEIPRFDAGLEGETALAALETKQVKGLCDRTAAFAKRRIGAERWCDYFSIAGACGAAGEESTDRQLRKMCEQPKAKCVDNYGADKQGVLSCDGVPTDIDCEVAVSTYETCLAKQVAAVGRYLDRIPKCSELTVDDCRPDGPPDYEGGGFEACEELRRRCAREFTSRFGAADLFDALQKH